MGKLFPDAKSGRLMQNPGTVQNSDLDITATNIPVAIRNDPTYSTYRKYIDGTTQGRTITSSVVRSVAVALVSNTAKTVASVVIPANSSWMVTGGVGYVDGAGTTHTVYRGGVSKTTNTLPALDTICVPTLGELIGFSAVGAMVTENSFGMQSYRYDNTTNAAVTLYLIALGVFAVGTCSAFGSIQAVSLM